VDALAGDHQGAAAVDPPIDARRSGWWGRWRSGGAGVAQPGLLGGAEWVGQAAQQGAVGVPQTSSARGAPHPLISAYLQAARQQAATSA
jgi:hypothetical protein